MKTPRNSIDALFHGRLQEIVLGTLRTAGLLGRWRPISGHLAASSKLGAKAIFSRHRFRHDRLANSHGYWQRRSSHNTPRATALRQRLVAAEANLQVKRSGRSQNWLGTRLAIIPSPS
jgi:hypothetical protein